MSFSQSSNVFSGAQVTGLEVMTSAILVVSASFTLAITPQHRSRPVTMPSNVRFSASETTGIAPNLRAFIVLAAACAVSDGMQKAISFDITSLTNILISLAVFSNVSIRGIRLLDLCTGNEPSNEVIQITGCSSRDRMASSTRNHGLCGQCHLRISLTRC